MSYLAESWGFEIASLIYKAGAGRLRFGPAHSDGLPTKVTGVLNGPAEGALALSTIIPGVLL